MRLQCRNNYGISNESIGIWWAKLARPAALPTTPIGAAASENEEAGTRKAPRTVRVGGLARSGGGGGNRTRVLKFTNKKRYMFSRAIRLAGHAPQRQDRDQLPF